MKKSDSFSSSYDYAARISEAADEFPTTPIVSMYVTEINSFAQLSTADVLEPVSLNLNSGVYLTDREWDFLAEKVRDFDALETLTLSGSNIRRCGYPQVLGSLMDKRRLLYLDLSRNHLLDEHVGQLASVFPSFPSLETLKLGYNQITDNGMRLLSPGLDSVATTLKVLHLQRNQITANFDVSRLERLIDLDVTYNPLTQEAWEGLMGQLSTHRMDCLRLNGVEVTEPFQQLIHSLLSNSNNSFRKCQFLEMTISSLSTGLETLVRCSHLSFRNIQGPIFPPHRLLGLTHLDVSYCSVGAQGLIQLMDAAIDIARGLKYLNVSGNFCDREAANAIKSRISEFSDLTDLELSNFCTNNDDFKTLLQGIRNPALTYLNLSGNMSTPDASGRVVQELANMYQELKTLQETDVSDNVLKEVAPCINVWGNLTALSLERTDLSPLEGSQLLSNLRVFRHMQSLTLSGLDLFHQNSAESIGFELPTELRNLRLSKCRLPPVDTIRRVLAMSPRLEEIDLSAGKLSQDFLLSFFEGVSDTIKSINLSYTDCGDYACDILETQSTRLGNLTYLYIRHNGISDEGAEKLIGRLYRLPFLRTLDLAGNRILGTCFDHVSALEKSNLTSLDLRGNAFPKEKLETWDLFGKFRNLVDLKV